MHWTVASFLMTLGFGPMGPDAPAREPQFAVSRSNVALVFGAGQSIYFSLSADSGRTFSTPVKVAESDVVPLTRHRGPRVVFAGSKIVITAVVGKTAAEGAHAHGLPSDGDLIAWRSMDGGKAWSKGIVINDVPGAPTEGLHGLASDGGAGCSRRGLIIEGATARNYTARSRLMAAQRGPGTCCYTSRRMEVSANAVILQWPSIVTERFWSCGATRSAGHGTCISRDQPTELVSPHPRNSARELGN